MPLIKLTLFWLIAPTMVLCDALAGEIVGALTGDYWAVSRRVDPIMSWLEGR